MVKTGQEFTVVYGTEDLLTSLCNSVTRVHNVATHCPVSYTHLDVYKRQVYATLGDKMKNDEVHARSIKAYTPAEWATLAA